MALVDFIVKLKIAPALHNAPGDQKLLAGTFCAFVASGINLGHPMYTVISRRGGFRMATIEWRNQWHRWSVKFDSEVPISQEILAEIYVFLKHPQVTPPRPAWRAAVRDWLIKWL